MIICSDKNSVSKIWSTEELLELFGLAESELVWYIKAAELQLSSPGCRGLKFMGKAVRCSYSVEDPVEADFEHIRGDRGAIHILVALDLKRIVLLVSIEKCCYEIWLGYKQRETDYKFFEKYFELSFFQSNGQDGFA